MTQKSFSCKKPVRDCLICELAPCPLLKEVLDKYSQGEAAPVPEYKAGDEDPRNRLNHLSGEEWLYFTKTVMTTSYPSAYGHYLRKQHGANKPPQLMKELIEFFTKKGDRVLDPFAGVGGTLLGASICDPPRKSVGIEINPKWIEIYRRVLEEYPEIAAGEMHLGDCRQVMQTMEDNSFDFIAADPPYNLQLKRTMCTGKDSPFNNRHTDYNMISQEEGDIANAKDYDDFLRAMGEVFTECFRVLKSGRYMVVILRNAYQKGRYIFTHADIARVAQEVNGGRGFIPKGEKVWYQAGARLRPYGYPFAYVPNIVHQYILILQKPNR